MFTFVKPELDAPAESDSSSTCGWTNAIGPLTSSSVTGASAAFDGSVLVERFEGFMLKDRFESNDKIVLDNGLKAKCVVLSVN